MMKITGSVLLVFTVLLGMLALPVMAQAGCPSGYFATTLAREGTPNLFRLGIKNGVVWTRIIRPNGSAPNPARVFPDETLCVPGGSATSAAAATTSTVTVMVVTPTPVSAAESAALFQEKVAAYCAGTPRNGLPADLGSCLIEAREVIAGNMIIVQENVACKVDEVATVNGRQARCSKLGTKWLRFP